jgi:cell division protein FtsL
MSQRATSAAVRLDGAERARTRRSFEVIEGRGLDARAREGVGAELLARLRWIAFAAAVLLVLSVARVAVTSATVTILKDNASLRSDIKAAQSQRADLEFQRTLLSDSSRIDRIATQNLGMKLASSGESVDVSAYLNDADTSQGVAER